MAAYKGPTLKELQKRKNPAALQARVQQLAANPGTRGLVDTSLLQRFGLTGLARKRLLNERLNAEVVPGSPMTNRDLAREANAAMDVQYGDQRRLLERQQAQAPDYYDAYLAELKRAQAGATAQGTQTGEAISKLYGSGPMAPGSNQATLGQAQAGTAQLLGQTQANYQQALQNAVQSGKLKALADIGQRRADLAEKSGAANVAYRSKRRSEELTNVATSALAGVKTEAAQSAQTQKGLDFLAKTGHTPAFAAAHPGQFAKDVAAAKKKPTHGRSQEEIDRPYLTKYGLTYNQFKAAVAKGQRPKPLSSKKGKGGSGGSTDSPVTGPGSLPRAEEAKRVGQVTRAAQYLHDVKIPDKDPKTGAIVYKKARNRGEVIAWLKSHGINPDLLGVANSLAANNLQGLGPKGIKHAHNAGLHVGGRWKRVKGA